MGFTTVLSLDDVGRRYDHYMELREIFAEGVEIIKNSQRINKNETNALRQKSLQHAVDEIDNRLEILSGYNGAMGRYGVVGKEIEAIPRLTEGSNAKQEREIQQSNTDSNYSIEGGEGETDEPAGV